ncbi:hypothetical protein JR316_0001419 [Psilocybe cubensis]|uniref:Uncharacterized protein n=1 Tax=Psilocybe cubensis TaxID=181762 RepID=A0ACB8HH45_PSICU|nr:hypothetical protein JR316_0001419 [Psilocybe cubensis]KAH9487345.1 hypothetical protein JR316_0001419 [Psilocybe cubensis]
MVQQISKSANIDNAPQHSPRPLSHRQRARKTKLDTLAQVTSLYVSKDEFFYPHNPASKNVLANCPHQNIIDAINVVTAIGIFLKRSPDPLSNPFPIHSTTSFYHWLL